MFPAFLASDADGGADAVPATFVTATSWPSIRATLPATAQRFAAASGFEPKPGQHLALPAANGGLGGLLFGIEDDNGAADPFRPGRLFDLVPGGACRFANAPPDPRLAALAFALQGYRFARYRKTTDGQRQLVLPPDLDGEDLTRIAEGVSLARDLVNTPANDMGPADLAEAAETLARRHDASFRVVVGDDLITRNFPLIHAVGRAATPERAPRLIDMVWGDEAAPKVTLVGKGVCFDTGGLDIKPDSAMLNMKKDMGGAASVLALAHMIMSRGLDVRLRVLIPAVENAVSAASFRPRDIYRSRQGLTVEIGNTDAEGRLVLADALTLAGEETPDLLIDMATLTGAARVALGPDIPPFYTDDEALAADLARHATAEHDPLWRLPLWSGYESMLDSKIADMNNVSTGGFAGSITAALFLRRFAKAARSWLHLDIFAWNPTAKAGRPEGGECQAARALYALLCERYG